MRCVKRFMVLIARQMLAADYSLSGKILLEDIIRAIQIADPHMRLTGIFDILRCGSSIKKGDHAADIVWMNSPNEPDSHQSTRSIDITAFLSDAVRGSLVRPAEMWWRI